VSDIDSLRRRALSAHQAGKLSEAETLYKEMLARAPASADSWRLYGICLLHDNRPRDAVEALGRSVALNGDDAETLYALGAAFRACGLHDEALARFEAALIVQPDHAGAHNAMGSVWQHKGKMELAERAYRRSLACDDAQIDASLNLGTLLLSEDRAADAVPYLSRAAKSPTHSQTALLRLGRAHRLLRDETAALAAFDTALAADPQDAHAGYDRALSLLALDRFAEGFDALEARTRRSDMRPWPTGTPIWDGGDIAGKRVFVFAEQGQGDQLQFVRYVPLLADKGARVTLEAHPRLRPVLQTLRGVDKIVTFGAEPAGHDFIAPLLSLPRHLGPAPAAAGADPYLAAPDGPEILSVRSGTGPLRIGLVWSGNPQQPTNPRRSCSLDDLRPLADLTGVALYSLQKGSAATDLRLASWAGTITDLGPLLTDFGATARTLDALDLLITTDTAIAHLAGAMGNAAWVLLSYTADWRWSEGQTTPWYSSLRLFRQPKPGDWASVVEAVGRALEAERESLQSRA